MSVFCISFLICSPKIPNPTRTQPQQNQTISRGNAQLANVCRLMRHTITYINMQNDIIRKTMPIHNTIVTGLTELCFILTIVWGSANTTKLAHHGYY